MNYSKNLGLIIISGIMVVVFWGVINTIIMASLDKRNILPINTMGGYTTFIAVAQLWMVIILPSILNKLLKQFRNKMKAVFAVTGLLNFIPFLIWLISAIKYSSSTVFVGFWFFAGIIEMSFIAFINMYSILFKPRPVSADFSRKLALALVSMIVMFISGMFMDVFMDKSAFMNMTRERFDDHMFILNIFQSFAAFMLPWVIIWLRNNFTTSKKILILFSILLLNLCSIVTYIAYKTDYPQIYNLSTVLWFCSIALISAIVSFGIVKFLLISKKGKQN